MSFIDDNKQEVDEFLERIDNMRSDTDYQWADATLSGIYDWVSEHNYFTEKQLTAVDNIEAAVLSRG